MATIRLVRVERAPLRRSRVDPGCRTTSPPSWTPLVGLSALQSVISNRPVTRWVRHARHDLVVSDGKNGFYRLPSAACSRKRFHPLVSRTPLQSVPGPACPARRNAGATFLGVATFPLRDVNRKQIARWLPDSSADPPSTFLTSSTVCFTPGLVGLFHPTATSRVLTFRGFVPRKAGTARRRLVPSRRWLGAAASGCPEAPRHRAPPSGLYSLRGPVAPTPVFSRRGGPIPSWCSSSSRFSLAAP